MRMISLLCTILVLTTLPTKSPADHPPEGCVAPDTIAALLGKIQDANWQGMSLERLRSMWPKDLTDIECDSNLSRSVMSQDRIINGHCQCCATFTFKAQRKQDGARGEQLDGVIINYSTRRRDALVDIAKKFASASGLRQAQLKTVGLGSEQSFQWETTKAKERSVYTLELRFTRKARLWQLYFTCGRYVIEPSSLRRPTDIEGKNDQMNANWTVMATYLNGPGIDNHLGQTNAFHERSLLPQRSPWLNRRNTDASENLLDTDSND